jgi:hypothetical protein
LFRVKNANFLPNFSEKIFKNHNIGPWQFFGVFGVVDLLVPHELDQLDQVRHARVLVERVHLNLDLVGGVDADRAVVRRLVRRRVVVAALAFARNRGQALVEVEGSDVLRSMF